MPLILANLPQQKPAGNSLWILQTLLLLLPTPLCGMEKDFDAGLVADWRGGNYNMYETRGIGGMHNLESQSWPRLKTISPIWMT